MNTTLPYNELPKNGLTAPLAERRNQLIDKLGFVYLNNNEFNLNTTYILLDSNTLGWMRIVKTYIIKDGLHKGKFGFLNRVSQSCMVVPYSRLIGQEVTLSFDGLVFKGRITELVPPNTLISGKNNMDCFVFWYHGQKNIPMGWVNLNLLSF